MKRTNGRLRYGFQAFILGLLCCLMISAAPVQAASTRTIGVVVEFGQSEARSMLEMINAFRKSSDAWAWNSSNTEKIRYSHLNNLKYDYNLEFVAMLRAAELAVSFSHTRPDGTDCFTAGGWGSGSSAYGSAAGENIAAGYGSAASVFRGWQETNEMYGGQGHRRNMLSSTFTSTGIGHVVVNGTDYWVQEFGNSGPGTASDALDGVYGVRFDVLSEYVSGYQFRMSDGSTSRQVAYGEKGQLPDPSLYIKVNGKTLPAAADLYWKNSDETVATFDEEGVITSHKVGKTVISAEYDGNTFSYTIEVVPADISGWSVTAADQVYNGSAFTPQPEVRKGDRVLAAGTDYTVQYASNVNAGTAKVTVKGLGNYTGTATGSFRIRPLDLSGGSVAELMPLTYTGKALTQPVTVTLNARALQQNRDYTLSWSGNTDAGTAGVKIEGTGNYTGSMSRSFAILPADIGSAAVTAPVQSYTGYSLTPPVSVIWDGQKLTEGTDFTVSYSSNVEIGTAGIAITGQGNFTGTAAGAFEIVRYVPMSLAKGKSFSIGGAVYTVTKAGESGDAAVRFMKLTSNISALKIPSTVTWDGIVYKVTSIYKSALRGHAEIRTVSVGNYVTSIGAKAFYRCTGLTTVTLGTRVASIGKQAFYGCAKLKKLTVKSKRITASKMGAKAFKGIYAKAAIRVPAALTGEYRTILRNAGVGSGAKFTGI